MYETAKVIGHVYGCLKRPFRNMDNYTTKKYSQLIRVKLSVYHTVQSFSISFWYGVAIR